MIEIKRNKEESRMKVALAVCTLGSLVSPIYAAVSMLQANPLSPAEIEAMVQRQGLANTVSVIFLFLSVVIAIFLLKHIRELTNANIAQTKSHQEETTLLVKSHQESIKILVDDNRTFLKERMDSMDKATQLAHDVVECFGPATRRS